LRMRCAPKTPSLAAAVPEPYSMICPLPIVRSWHSTPPCPSRSKSGVAGRFGMRGREGSRPPRRDAIHQGFQVFEPGIESRTFRTNCLEIRLCRDQWSVNPFPVSRNRILNASAWGGMVVVVYVSGVAKSERIFTSVRSACGGMSAIPEKSSTAKNSKPSNSCR